MTNNTAKSKRSKRMMMWLVAGTLGAGTIGGLPSIVTAQETVKISEDKVPAAVLATARANYLDATDVAFRRTDEGKEIYQVGFDTPSKLRMQVRIDKNGQLLMPPQPAPNQPDGAPKGAERDRVVANWAERVRASQAAGILSVPGQVPVAPVPSPIPAPPTTPNGIAAPAAATVSTEIRQADLPRAVVESLSRFTVGARDVNYYRQDVENRARYQAIFSGAKGGRQEVTVADNGSLMSGPLMLTSSVDDKSLQADHVRERQLATATRTEPRDLPVRVMDALTQYSRAGTDVRYRRDTFGDGTLAYTAHWVQPGVERRYFVVVGEDGTLRQAPALSMYQPSAEVQQGASGVAATWQSLPDAVKKTLEPLTRQDRDAKYFRQTDDNKISYGSIYSANGRSMWVRVDEAGKTIVNPVSATTGKPIGDEPRQASAKLSAAMLKDRVNFSELPKAVQAKVLKETDGAKDVVNMKHNDGGKAKYHTAWTDLNGERRELWLDGSGGAIAIPKLDN